MLSNDNNISFIDYSNKHLSKMVSYEENIKKISLNMSKENLLSLVGEPDRVDKSEYGFQWYVYNRYEKIFFMVGIDNSKVVGFYSNTTPINFLEDITFTEDKDYIRKKYSTKNTFDYFIYKLDLGANDEYDIIQDNKYYLTVFYDKYNNDKISSFEIIETSYKRSLIKELSKKSFKEIYIYDDELKKSFEYQMFDLINSTREKYGLNKLKFDKNKGSDVAKKHALDMIKHGYFGHKDTEGKVSKDRLNRAGIKFYICGENLAGGQLSSIYAHEALMNSKGHRKNILNDEYENVGIGVEFTGKYQTYYVQNFYSD